MSTDQDILAAAPRHGEATLTFELGANAKLDATTGRPQGDILAKVAIAAPNFHVLMLGLTSAHNSPDQIVAGFLGIKDTMTEEQIRHIAAHAPIEQKVKGKVKMFRFNLVAPMTVDGEATVFRAHVDASTPDIALWALMQVSKPEAVTGYINALLENHRAA